MKSVCSEHPPIGQEARRTLHFACYSLSPSRTRDIQTQCLSCQPQAPTSLRPHSFLSPGDRCGESLVPESGLGSWGKTLPALHRALSGWGDARAELCTTDPASRVCSHTYTQLQTGHMVSFFTHKSTLHVVMLSPLSRQSREYHQTQDK